MVAASKPTSWLSMQLHILKTTQVGLGALAGGLGCFPFDYEAYPPQSDCRITTYGIRSLTVVGTRVRAREQSVLYPRMLSYATLALKLFRREPAITGFDWPFTPIHSSSKHFSTCTGSALHLLLQRVQPGHG